MSLPIFPGAEGYGTETRAAYGDVSDPTVYKVTNLNTSGAGSFYAAVMASGPRVIIFEISGNIPQNSHVIVTNPYLTIAGQTAPSPGITFTGLWFELKTHDVLMQHIRVRPGETSNYDALTICAQDPYDAYSIVVDHCSLSWGTDENIGLVILSSGFGIDNVTFNNCIISESLRYSSGRGVLAGEGCQNISFIRNIGALNEGNRHPLIQDDVYIAMINNLIYSDERSIFPHGDGIDALKTSAVGNTIKRVTGTSGSNDYAINVWTDVHADSDIYVLDNDCELSGFDPDTSDPWDAVFNANGMDAGVFAALQTLTSPLDLSEITILGHAAAVAHVLGHAGARPLDRDEVDEYIINSWSDGTREIIDYPGPEIGNVDLSSGHDWSGAGGESFQVKKNAGGATTINLDENCANLAAIITMINTDLPAGVTAEADSGTFVKIYISAPDWFELIEIDGLATLGMNAGVYASGFPALAENDRSLTVPSNPHVVQPSGYTNLEEWLHSYSNDVENEEIIWGYATLAWSLWKDSGGNLARKSSDFGKLQLYAGETFYSDVRDLDDANLKTLQITFDDYAFGQGSGNIEWRGSATIFDWNAGSPSWEAYSVPADKSWRYVQARVSVDAL